MQDKKLTPVVVTSAERGVFFGYAEPADVEKTSIRLKDGRLCLYWSKDMRGFMGLAKMGPSETCRVGPAADIIVKNVTSVTFCTDSAVERWEKEPWGENS